MSKMIDPKHQPANTNDAPDDTPPGPFTGAGALRAIDFILTEVRAKAANENALIHSNDNREAADVRRDMDERLALPRWIVDWFTGKPILDGRSKKNLLSSVAYVAVDMSIAAAAAAGAATLVSEFGAVTAPIVAWLLIILTGRLRKMQTLIGHEASHRNFFLRGDRRRDDGSVAADGAISLNDLIGEMATTFALSLSVEDYRRDHDVHHALDTYTTEHDPDTQYVRRLKNFPWALFNPVEFARDFAHRLNSNLFASSPLKRGMSWAWVSILLGLMFVMPTSAWFISVFLPWAILFRVSAVLQILSLHDWDLPPAASHQDYANRTWGRFSGFALPPRGLRGFRWLTAWACWWSEILLLELPFRVGVLSPDLQAHDVHHLEWLLANDMGALPKYVDDWKNQPFRRQEVIRDSGDALKMADREVWGVRAMWRLARRNLNRLNGRPETK